MLDLEQLKKHPSVLRLYNERVRLTKDAKEYLGLCPLHQERTPSFKVFSHEGSWIWKCFGCSKAGSILDLIQQMDNCTLKEAIKTAQAGLGDQSWEAAREQVDAVFQPPVAEDEGPKRTLTLQQIAGLERGLENSQPAKDWLKSRGISLETAKSLHIGFKQDLGRTAFGEKPEIVSGGWIAFPCVEGDTVMGIKFRSIAKKTFRKQPQMATTLYNVDDIDPLEPVYLVEGECDAAILKQAGFRAVSLPSASTTVTPEMRDQLMTAECVILAGDCDGGVGSQIMERLRRDLGDRSYLLKWPDGKKDANQTFLETSKGDVSSFRTLVEQLTVDAKGNPMPEFTSIQKALTSGTNLQIADHPHRLHFPWVGVDKMAVLLPGSVLAFSATNALVHGTRVFTPGGWKAVQTLEVGDEVIGSDGRPTRVLAVLPKGVRPSYTLTFSDETTASCDAEHLWGVRDRSRVYGENTGYRVLQTQQLSKCRLLTGRSTFRFSVPLVQPVCFRHIDLPIPAYTLGALIGDGGIKSYVTLAGPKEKLHVVGRVQTELEAIGHTTVRSNGDNKLYVRNERPRAENKIRSGLRSLGLLGTQAVDKFIPTVYLYSGLPDRLALLQGLLDTDGSVSESGVLSFTTMSERLKNDIVFLVRSLGGYTTGQDRRYTADGCYQICFSFNNDICPVSDPRKILRYRVGKKSKTKRKNIVGIELAGPAEMTCIVVEAEDGLFAIDDFTLTHNSGQGKTNWTNQLSVYNAREYNEVVLNYQVELSVPEIANMTAAHVLRKDRNHLGMDDNKQAAKLFRDARYYVGNDPTLTSVGDVIDLLEKAIRRLGATVVILDNLHALCRGDNEIRDQADASRRIKLLAQQYQVKFVVVCQPRKADSKNKGKTLHITDVKGAGAIIEDADALFSLHRNYIQNPDPNNPPMDNYESETEVHCLKARAKGTGAAFTKLYFHGALATFTDMTALEPPPA